MTRVDLKGTPQRLRMGQASAVAAAAAVALALTAQSCGVMSKSDCAERATCRQTVAAEIDSSNPVTPDGATEAGQSGEDAAIEVTTLDEDVAFQENVAVGNDVASGDASGEDSARRDAVEDPAVEGIMAADAVSTDASEGGEWVDAGACPSTLRDQVSTCTSASSACIKGCGPKTASGHLGRKGCSCNQSTLVYNCQNCAYPIPLPACYLPPATPAACVSGVTDGARCAAPCSAVCTLGADGANAEGCVCVPGAAGSTWSCATQWW